LVRDPADISQASAPFGVPGGALAGAGLFLGQNSFRDGGSAMQPYIIFNIRYSVIEAETDQRFHGLPPYRFWAAIG
jgi:hypothetical protein